MDLVADKLHESLCEDHAMDIDARLLRPRMPIRLGALPMLARQPLARNADRLAARFLDYPRWLGHELRHTDVFHVTDHSYAHLVHGLPSTRTVVTCHDLDTFRSVLEPERERRGRLFRAMTRRILTGMQRAARVTCDSVATRDGILAYDLLPAEKLEVVPLGVDPAMRATGDPAADERAARLLGPPDRPDEVLLHVGSTIARKRIDVLLEVFASVRAAMPGVRLVRAGGPFTAEQEALAGRLGLEPGAVTVLPYIDRATLAAVYRRATLVLQPSDAEGFGFPVVEAMACGSPVIASDLPVLREVGGDAAQYCRVGDVAQWSAVVAALLRERRDDPQRWRERRQAALTQAGGFSWARFTNRMAEIYREVAGAAPARLTEEALP